MLRLPPQKLADDMRTLWPHLLSELVNVFDVPDQDRDLFLTFEALKLVDLMSQLNIEDF